MVTCVPNYFKKSLNVLVTIHLHSHLGSFLEAWLARLKSLFHNALSISKNMNFILKGYGSFSQIKIPSSPFLYFMPPIFLPLFLKTI